MNTQSLYSNFSKIEVLLETMNPVVLACSETCLTNEISDFEIAINGYDIVRCDSNSRHTGGVLIYIKSTVTHSVILNKCFDGNLWCLSINVKQSKLKGIISVLYHSPSASNSIFLNYLTEILDNILKLEKLNIIVGDFNIDVAKVSQCPQKNYRKCWSSSNCKLFHKKNRNFCNYN